MNSSPSFKKAAAHIVAGSAVFFVALISHSIFAATITPALLRPFAPGSVLTAHLDSAHAIETDGQQSQQTVPPGTVSGHIYNSATGEPLPKATVTLTPSRNRTLNSSNSPTGIQVTRSGPDGSFTFATVAPGKYLADADHVGFLPQQYGQSDERSGGGEVISVDPGQSLNKVDFKLGPAGIISGNILDEDNEPMQGVQVTAVKVRYTKNGAQQEISMRSVATDDRGSYRLFGLVPGFYCVRVQGGPIGSQSSGPSTGTAYQPTYYPGVGYVEDAQRIQVAPGVETPGISFSVGTQSTHTISGVVIDSTGGQSDTKRFVISASRGVNSAGEIGPGFPMGTGNHVSNPDGSFSISGLPSGDYTLSARSIQVVTQQGTGSFSTISAESDVGYASVRVAGGDARVNIPVSHPSSIRGRLIVEGTNQPPPVQGIRLSLQSQLGANPGGGNPSATIDPTGSFEFKSVGSGQYDFNIVGGQATLYLKQIACTGKDYTTQPIALESGLNLNDCVLTLGTDAGTLSGQVLDSGKPVGNLIVVAIPESPDLRALGRYTFTGKSDAEGNFQIGGVIPGDYLLFAVAANDEQSYFARDFAEKNIRDAERVAIHANETKTINPAPSAAQ